MERGGTGQRLRSAEVQIGGSIPDSGRLLIDQDMKNDVILRIRDDCLPFNPGDRKELLDSGDALKNVGIRIVYRIARDIDYQNIMGLNVLTIRI